MIKRGGKGDWGLRRFSNEKLLNVLFFLFFVTGKGLLSRKNG